MVCRIKYLGDRMFLTWFESKVKWNIFWSFCKKKKGNLQNFSMCFWSLKYSSFFSKGTLECYSSCLNVLGGKKKWFVSLQSIWGLQFLVLIESFNFWGATKGNWQLCKKVFSFLKENQWLRSKILRDCSLFIIEISALFYSYIVLPGLIREGIKSYTGNRHL